MNIEMKLLLTMLFFISTSSCSTFNKMESREKIRVINIDSNSLEFHHAIKASFRAEEVLIVSKKLNQDANCENKIYEGKEYFVKLEEEKQIQIDTSLSVKVDGQGLYIREKEFLKENEKVFSSPSLNGLCLIIK